MREIVIACLLINFGTATFSVADGRHLMIANELFDEAKRLLQRGETASACSKFAASLKLARRLGVLLNLAACNEQLGRTATAWIQFGEAAALARQLRDPREGFARKRAMSLQPRLSRLVIEVADKRREFRVTRNGIAVPSEAYGLAVPVDPGEHDVEAGASGVEWSTKIVVQSGAEIVTVRIPAMMRVEQPKYARFRRVGLTTWVTGSLAVTGVGVGAIYGFTAISSWGKASQGCDRAGHCTDRAYLEAIEARRASRVSTAAFAIAGGAAAVAIASYFRSPRVQIVPAVTSTHAVLTLGGAF